MHLRMQFRRPLASWPSREDTSSRLARVNLRHLTSRRRTATAVDVALVKARCDLHFLGLGLLGLGPEEEDSRCSAGMIGRTRTPAMEGLNGISAPYLDISSASSSTEPATQPPGSNLPSPSSPVPLSSSMQSCRGRGGAARHGLSNRTSAP